MKDTKKYTAIYHKYRSSETVLRHIECLEEDLLLELRCSDDLSLRYLFDGFIQDIKNDTTNNPKINSFPNYKTYNKHPSFDLYSRQIAISEKLKKLTEEQLKIKILMDRIENDNLDYKDWFDSEEKICFITSDMTSYNHVFIFEKFYLYSENNKEYTMPYSPIQIKENDFSHTRFRNISKEDLMKIKKCFNLN